MASQVFRRETQWQPAYDRCAEGYGIHGVNMSWVVHGAIGSVSWSVFTNWQLPHIVTPPLLLGPTPSDLGYHADAPQYPDQSSISCSHRPNKICYYDGSGLNAAWPMKTLVTEGGEAVWKALESYYRSVFEDGPWPWKDDTETWQSVQRFRNLGQGIMDAR